MPDQKGADKPNSNLRTLAGGASLFFVGNVISNVFGFLVNLILTRGLGASLYGIYSYSNVFITFSLALSNLGSDNSILKFVPQYNDQPTKRNVMLGLAYLTSFLASLLMATVLYLIAPTITSYTLEDPLLTDVFRIIALVIPFNTLLNLISALFKGYEDMFASVMVSMIVHPISRFVTIGLALLLGASLIGVIAAIVVAAALTLAFALWFVRKRTSASPTLLQSQKHASEFYRFSLPLTVNEIGSILYKKVDILMVGFFLSSASVGIYNISVLLAGFISLPLTAFNQLFPPIASKLYNNNDLDELRSVYSSVTRWIFTFSLFPCLAVIVYVEEILLIFGEDFAEGAIVLILLSSAQLINAASGSSGYMLMMTDHQYWTMTDQVASSILNVILNYYMIMQFGIIGAAMATASVIMTVNVVQVLQVWYLEGFFPYSRTYLKPLVAAVVSSFCMYFIGAIMDVAYILLLLVGGAIGAVTFIGTLYILGIRAEELNLLKKLVRR